MATKRKVVTHPVTHEEDPFLTLREVGDQLGVSRRTIGRWLVDPDISFQGQWRPGGLAVRQSEVDKWLGSPLDKQIGAKQ